MNEQTRNRAAEVLNEWEPLSPEFYGLALDALAASPEGLAWAAEIVADNADAPVVL